MFYDAIIDTVDAIIWSRLPIPRPTLGTFVGPALLTSCLSLSW